MNILHFSTLFPNSKMPQHGVFVAERLRHLIASGGVDASVMAPVPWFPLRGPRFGAYGTYASVPLSDEFDGVPVFHDRFPAIPKIGMTVAPKLLEVASAAAIRRRWGNLDAFDVIDAHYFYPDGVAAVMLGARFGKPVVITARGSDINVLPSFRLPRKWIIWAAQRAAGLVTVSDALREALIKLGAPSSRIEVLRNGVDLDRFRPLDRASIRRKLDLQGRVLISVGNLVELKGHDIAIRALNETSDASLLIVGDGPDRQKLESLAVQLGLKGRVRLVGRVNQEALVELYNAADCLVLCSRSEGMANVLLESLACGTPTVATAVGGNPEVVEEPLVGRLFSDRSADGLNEALNKLWESLPDRGHTREYAESFGWESTSRRQLEIFARVKGV